MTEKTCFTCKASLDPDTIFCNECGQTQPQISSGTCPACRASVDRDSRFCPECSFDLAPPLQKDRTQLACPSCQKVTLKSDKYCRHCSFDLSTAVEKKESSAHYCTKCGKPFIVTDRFCRHCAADISESNRTVAIPVVRAPHLDKPQSSSASAFGPSDPAQQPWPTPPRTPPCRPRVHSVVRQIQTSARLEYGAC